MTTITTVAADLAGRRAAHIADPTAIPSTRDRNENFSAELRSTLIEKDGKEFVQLDGVASVVETWYEMYDFWGPFNEKVAKGAFDKTLSSGPDVAFLLNHKGMTMARTKTSKTLELWTNEQGSLAIRALLNAQRQDVQDLRHAIDDGDIDQMSFAFRITDGSWNFDFTEFTILEVDLDRGDVSAVNYGANPYTSISARARQAFDAIATLEGPALAEARARIEARMAATAPDLAPVATENARTGLSLSLARLQASDRT